MSLSNTGKSSEQRFEDYWDAQGKGVYLERRIDLAHVRGLNKGKAVTFPKQGNDYFLTVNGTTSYAEVKSCSSQTSFPFSQIEKGQWIAATRVTAAGGRYVFYIHAVATDNWYEVPAVKILTTYHLGKSSLTWKELEPFRATIN